MEPGTIVTASLGVFVSSSLATFVAQVTEAPGGVITITSAGATVSAVGALALVVRSVLKGDLVAKKSSETERSLAQANDALVRINEQLVKIVADAATREDRLFGVLTGNPAEQR